MTGTEDEVLKNFWISNKVLVGDVEDTSLALKCDYSIIILVTYLP